MCFAVFQPEQTVSRKVAHNNFAVFFLKGRQKRGNTRGKGGQRCHNKFARDIRTLPFDPADQLAELVFGRLRHAQKVCACLCRRVPACMPLEQLDAQLFLQRINVADDGRMMDTQHISRPTDRAQPRNVKRSAHFIPVLHSKAPDLEQKCHLLVGADTNMLQTATFPHSAQSATRRAPLDSNGLWAYTHPKSPEAVPSGPE